MNKETVTAIKAIQADLAKAFADIKIKYGYDMKLGNSSYDHEGNFSTKLVGQKIGALSADAQRYNAMQVLMRLPPLTWVMTFGSKQYVIAGLNTTGTKVKATLNGKTFLFPVDLVCTLWKQARDGVQVLTKVEE